MRLLSAGAVEAIFDEQANGIDLVLGVPLRFGIGYGLSSDVMPIGPNRHTCFWGGWGGSLVVNDVDASLTVAYVMNRMGEGTVGDLRGAGDPARRLHGAAGDGRQPSARFGLGATSLPRSFTTDATIVTVSTAR